MIVLDRTTWKYDDSCSSVYLFCDSGKNNTCNYIGCANTDYIQGWDERTHPFPVRCNNQKYCPDNGSQCTALAPVGKACEPQRDDECAGKDVICLNSTCYMKAAPLGGHCGSDRTDYMSYDAAGQGIRQTIVRDNCTEASYCDDAKHVCIRSKALGSECWQDRECQSGTCSDDGMCTNGPDVFHRIANWLWGVLAGTVFLFVLITLGVLWLLHRYQSRLEHQKSAKFFGDNDEFSKKYQMYQQGFETSVVYLTTPDYKQSAALTQAGADSHTSSNPSNHHRHPQQPTHAHHHHHNSHRSSLAPLLSNPAKSSAPLPFSLPQTSFFPRQPSPSPSVGHSNTNNTSLLPPLLPPHTPYMYPEATNPMMDPAWYSSPHPVPKALPQQPLQKEVITEEDEDEELLNKWQGQYNDLITWVDNEFWEQADDIYQEKISNLQQELKELQKETVAEIRLNCEKDISNVECFMNYQLSFIEHTFEKDLFLLEEEYEAEKKSVEQSLMASLQDKRKQLKEDQDGGNTSLHLKIFFFIFILFLLPDEVKTVRRNLRKRNHDTMTYPPVKEPSVKKRAGKNPKNPKNRIGNNILLARTSALPNIYSISNAEQEELENEFVRMKQSVY
ncbi:hypothetical protein BY458DRAFT_440762 [Sporodiniella umbellata]|nr:hypothetical protein BY458DRAFT_440762 [Sporodiniella umbellata]